MFNNKKYSEILKLVGSLQMTSHKVFHSSVKSFKVVQGCSFFNWVDRTWDNIFSIGDLSAFRISSLREV